MFFVLIINALISDFCCLKLLNDFCKKIYIFTIGLKDEIVPPEMMTSLYNSSDSLSKKMYEIPNGDHNGNWSSDPSYFSELMSFIYSNNKF